MFGRKRRRAAWFRKWRTIAVLATSLVIPLLFLLTVSTVSTIVPEIGGEYVEGIVGTPIHINPLLSQFNEVDRDLAALIFSGLTWIDERGEPRPDLARGWQISPDGLTYTFYLRGGVVWHDGAPFTAEDVLFTIRTIQHREFPGSPDLAEMWKTVRAEKLDDLTARFTLKEPYAPFLFQTSLGLLPSHLLKEPPVSGLAQNPFNMRPVGTGPFKVRDSSVQSVVLESSPAYYREKPYLSTVASLFFPTYEKLLEALKDRRVKGALLRSPLTSDLEPLRRDERLQVRSAPRFAYEVVFLNLNAPPFKEREVRQALSYAIDRQKIIFNEAEGQGIRADTPFLPGTWAYEPSAKRYDYSPDRAKAILEGAGWKVGSGGVREKGGVPLKFALFTDNNQRRVKIAEEVSRELALIGVKAEVAASGASGLVQNFLLPRRFEAALLGLVLGPDPDPYTAWHSSQREGSGYNFASLSNPRIDQLLERARKSTDQKERTSLYQEFQKAFAEEVPSLLLYYPTYFYAMDKEIKGVEVGNLFEGSDRFRSVAQWYIKTKRVEARGSLLENLINALKRLLGRQP